MIVTGPRWWLDPTLAVAPVTVLDRRDIERGGESSIGDVLQALPMTTGSPLNTNVNAPRSAEPRGVGGAAGDGSVRVSNTRFADGRVAQWPASTEQRSRCRRLGRSQHTADRLSSSASRCWRAARQQPSVRMPSAAS